MALPDSGKVDDMCIRLATIPQRDGRTDERTDRNGEIALCMLTRGKTD